MAIVFVIVDTQGMLAMQVLTFSAFGRCPYFLDDNS
jgi:hypothetical protein